MRYKILFRVVLTFTILGGLQGGYPQSSQTYQLVGGRMGNGGIASQSQSYDLISFSIGELMPESSTSENFQMSGGALVLPRTVISREAGTEIPSTFMLKQNYPNPFNATTTIEFGIPEQERAQIYIYNSIGQCIRTFDTGTQAPGYYKITWDGKSQDGQDMSSGLYFYKIQTETFEKTEKMMLLR